MKDETKAFYLIIAIGVGYLFPLSALTQPVDYWNLFFPDINIEFPLTTTFMWVNLIVLGLIVFFRQKSSVTFRIVGGFIGQLLVLLLVPNIPYFTTNRGFHFHLILILTAIAAAATSLIDSVAIGFAAQYPPQVLSGLQFGIGLSTLIGSIYRIFTKAVFSSIGTIESSIIYFYVGALTILSCILAYYYLLSLPISASVHSQKYESTAEENLKLIEAHHHQQQNNHTQQYASFQEPMVKSSKDLEEGSDRTKAVKRLLETTTTTTTTSSSFNIESTTSPTSTADDAHHTWLNKLRILRKVAYSQSLVFLVFFISLMIWPGMVTEIPTYNFPSLEESKWWSLLLLLNFAVFDCLGRLCTDYRLGLTSQNIWMVVVGRILLVPVVYWIVTKQFFLHSDLLSIGLVAITGFTNGYIGSLCVIMVTEDVHPEEKEIAGAFTGFFLNVGLVFGSTAALFFGNISAAS